jgi:hypothetical protein
MIAEMQRKYGSFPLVLNILLAYTPILTYGLIVRINPYEVYVNDQSFMEKLYRQDGRWDTYVQVYNAFLAHHLVYES